MQGPLGQENTVAEGVNGVLQTLYKQVAKLKESNQELQAAREAGDRDPVIRDAIGVRFSRVRPSIFTCFCSFTKAMHIGIPATKQ